MLVRTCSAPCSPRFLCLLSSGSRLTPMQPGQLFTEMFNSMALSWKWKQTSLLVTNLIWASTVKQWSQAMSHLQCGLVGAKIMHLCNIKIMVQEWLFWAVTLNVKSSNGVPTLCLVLVMVIVYLMHLDARRVVVLFGFNTNHQTLISSHLWSNLQAAESIKRIWVHVHHLRQIILSAVS